MRIRFHPTSDLYQALFCPFLALPHCEQLPITQNKQLDSMSLFPDVFGMTADPFFSMRRVMREMDREASNGDDG